MGGLEKVAYDSKEKILYGVSEQGFITMIDLANGPVDAPQLPIVISDKNTYTDIQVCSEEGVLFATTKDDPNPGVVNIYTTAKRTPQAPIPATSVDASPAIVAKPELVHIVEVGAGPDYVKPNSDCSILAVANEGEGDYDDVTGLTNPEGSVTLVKGPFLDAVAPPATSTVSFPWTDEELLAKGVQLPLSEKALEYWDDHSAIADDIDFSAARASYTGASVLEPEWLVWSADEKFILVNLQENSALVKINVAEEIAEDIYSYGLKSWENTPIDIIEDNGCATMPTVPGLHSVRTPDAITAIIVGDETYIATANEGDDVGYGAFEEKLKSKDIFDGNMTGMLGATADPAIFDPADPMAGQSKYFNSACGEAEGSPEWCATSLSMTIGSSMVDYSDPTAPIIKSMVAIGGRGISIYKLTDDGLDLVWDSGDEFETAGCAAYPWAHNGIQDEEFADVNGTLYMADEGIRETLEELNDPEIDGCEDRGDGMPGACALGDTVDERSLKDGYAAEAIVTGEACGKTYLATVSEKNSVGFLYDISDITNPKLVQVFHLSPASETKNPVVAHEDRTLGEIDAESIIFFKEDESPTGVPAILFAGAFSTTTSYWEFDCEGKIEMDGDMEDEKGEETMGDAEMDEEAMGDAEMDEETMGDTEMDEEAMGDAEISSDTSSAFALSGSFVAGLVASIVAFAFYE